MTEKSPLVLLILDGWGYREDGEYNAIAKAHTPQWDKWWTTCPHMLLNASGEPVGLPNAQMGNSEVGHMHIGAGRVIPQDYTRINQAIASGEYKDNPVFVNMITDMKRQNKAIHVMGLLSTGGVHSHENHLFEFLKLCFEHQFNNVCLHLFLDGRDTAPQSALSSLERLQAHLVHYPVASICSISGRYYAMDRDGRWERIEPVYHLLTCNDAAHQFSTPELALQSFYKQQINDEFIPPTLIKEGQAIRPGDSVFFFNFRSDRARQITHALMDKTFDGFIRKKQPELSHFVTMTRYSTLLATECAFPAPYLKNTLGEVIARQGLSQLRIAETEKYAHVTFFLNGGSEQVYDHEERLLIPSPQVATYDLQPKMNAPKLTDAIIDAINNKTYDVIIANYANADMVGHTGNFAATVTAIECLDQSMAAIGEALANVGGNMLITADHGNAEMMFDTISQQVQTAHTNLPVPLLYVGENWTFKNPEGSLTDIAPTVLTLLNIKPPSEMTGSPLMVNVHETTR